MLSDAEKIRKYVRALNYLCVTQIYLQNNFLAQNKLESDHIKPRLLGHWGTCPGINFVYANLNALIQRENARILFVLGSGHGFPALQANLFLEGTLEKFYPKAIRNADGIAYISKNFSWPYGFPSHSNPGAPGVILEGGELGYSLSTAYGSVLDNPDLITVCLVGDGEAETGPSATAWHLNKFIDPKSNGAVLPILHLNGYKISAPTVFGRMSTVELRSLFIGYGYEPLFVEEISGEDIYKKMIEVLNSCYEKIRKIQSRAREGKETIAPNWPMIILKTPKGWTGPKRINGQKIEDNYLSHQVVASNARNDINELKIIEDWLHSYNFDELYSVDKGWDKDIEALIPQEEYKIGLNKNAYPEKTYENLELPLLKKYAEEVPVPGFIGSSSMRRLGEYFRDIIEFNENGKNFRIFSPDETYSNKIDKVFDVTTRSFVWPRLNSDKDMSSDGRVIEMLSEHSLFGLLQGYILTGRHGVFVSYEAFVQIVSSMTDQYIKFLKIARTIPWRQSYSSLNIILTSSGWRQDHNGFSHQNPGFISGLFEKQDENIKIYFPPDGNSALVAMEKSLKSQNGVNVIVAGKTLEPRWLNLNQAYDLLANGLLTLDFASDEDPNLVLVGIGDYVTKEILAAAKIIKSEIPQCQIRCVTIIDPTVFQSENLDSYFTLDKPVWINFHGYPESLRKLFSKKIDQKRFEVRGYIENGSTTTPFDMHIRNKTSRWNIMLWAIEKLYKQGVITKSDAIVLNKKYEMKYPLHISHIIENGVDMPEVSDVNLEFNN